MKISFIGQTSVLGSTPTEKRIQALAHEYMQAGHLPLAYTATEKGIKNTAGVRLKYRPSFSPENPGGWLFTLLCVFSALRQKSDVIHLTSWRAGALASLAAALSPKTTLVWTISSMPNAGSITSKLVMWQAARACDAIIVPTRTMQYLLRLHFGILAAYVPDGYAAPTVKDIPAKTWGLRKGLYVFAKAATARDAKWIVEAYSATKSQKTLIVSVPVITKATKQLEKKYKKVMIIDTASTRQLSSLVRQAAVAIFADEGSDTSLLLTAMDAACAVVAVNEPLYSEVLGTSGKVVQRGDKQHLTEILDVVVKITAVQKEFGKAAHTRAFAHFRWNRLAEEYAKLYHYPSVRLVPMDSLQRSRISHPAVY